MREKIIHLDVGHLIVRTVDEGLEREFIHLPDDKDKEQKQEIFYPAEWIIQPSRQRNVSSKKLSAEDPERFADCSDRTEPAAKCLFTQDADCKNRNKDKETGGVNGVDDSGENVILQADQRTDGKETFRTGWPFDKRSASSGCTPLDEQIKFNPDPDAQQQECNLNG